MSQFAGNEEIVDEGINGVLVKVNDPVALAEKINLLCQSEAVLKELGENGYRMAKSKFNSITNVSEILSVYEKIFALTMVDSRI